MTLYQVCVLVIGIIVGFYWARVLKLVRKTKKKTGNSAQFVPREPLGRALRVIWYPTVTLWCLHPWLTLGLPSLPRVFAPLWTHPAVLLPAVTLAILAMWGTLICWRKMGTSWRMGINPGERTPLVITGPYAYVRHPIYALSSLLMIASALVVASPLMLAAAVIHLLFLQWEARREERNLLTVHPETYARFMENTGRFMPVSFKPFVP